MLYMINIIFLIYMYCMYEYMLLNIDIYFLILLLLLLQYSAAVFSTE